MNGYDQHSAAFMESHANKPPQSPGWRPAPPRDTLETFSEAASSSNTLSSKERGELPSSAFALPGRRYPIHDRKHARNALARVSQNGTPEEKRKVRAAVQKRYPNLRNA